MTMTNAQAALIAAANAAVRGSAVPLEPVLKRAAAYLQWLEAQDKPVPEATLVKLEPETGFEQAARAITQCKAVSNDYTRCLLASGHQPPHRNSHEGVHWVDKPVEPTHFLTAPTEAYAVCGRLTGRTEDGNRRATVRTGEVTCPECKEALGL